MKKRKLNYRFHNPNTAEATADYILKIMIEANKGKVAQAIRNVTEERGKKKEKYYLIDGRVGMFSHKNI